MTVRSTMSTLIQEMRLLASAGTADYTAGTVAYWTDEQLQTVLDRHSKAIRYQGLTPQASYAAGGSLTYTEYWSGLGCWEDNPSVLDNTYTSAGTANYSFNTTKGIVTFTADTAGAAYSITGTVFDLNAAAAEVWRTKASHYATAYDVTTDNHSLKRSQLATQCWAQAKTFEIKAPSWQSGSGNTSTGSMFAERGDM